METHWGNECDTKRRDRQLGLSLVAGPNLPAITLGWGWFGVASRTGATPATGRSGQITGTGEVPIAAYRTITALEIGDNDQSHRSKKTSLLEAGFAATKKFAEKVNVGASLFWSEPAFSQFAFDLVALLQGIPQR